MNIRIGIELNNIVRDINSQLLKYYKRDINKDFDESVVDVKSINFPNELEFISKSKKYEFMYVDYPFEIYGCANGMDRNIANSINSWMIELENRGDYGYDVSLFSLMENALTIQSTYHFLSKMGLRNRRMFFPKDGKEMWDEFDVIITTNERIIKNKPKDKIVVLIKVNGNVDLTDDSDLIYDDLTSLINDDEFIDKVMSSKRSNKGYTFMKRIINKIIRKK